MNKLNKVKLNLGPAWWCTAVIPAIWGAEVEGSESEASLGKVTLHLAFYPKSVHSGHMPASMWAQNGAHIKGISLELELGHKASTEKDLACIKFNN
jgi:hypothetical protein